MRVRPPLSPPRLMRSGPLEGSAPRVSHDHGTLPWRNGRRAPLKPVYPARSVRGRHPVGAPRPLSPTGRGAGFRFRRFRVQVPERAPGATAHVDGMGHATAHIEFAADEAEQIRQSIPPRTARWEYPRTFESAMVDAAVQKWRDDEAGRWSDARAGSGFLAPIMSEQALSWYTSEDDTHSRIVMESVVIPVAAQDDVIVKTVKVRVRVDAAQLAQARAAFVAARSSRAHVPFPLRSLAMEHAPSGAVEMVIAAVPAARKPVAVATEGKSVTRYEVVGPAGFAGRRVDGEDATQAGARALAVKLMSDDQTITSLDIRGRVVRDSGDDALVNVTRPAAENATVTVEFTTHAVKPNAQPVKYVVVFDYHH